MNMKTKLCLAACLLLISSFCYAQCDFYLFQANKKITMGVYDNKGKLTGKLVYKISDVKKSGSSYTSNYVSEIFDKKDKLIGSSTGSVNCDGEKLMMDMKMALPTNSAFTDVKIKSNSSSLDFPSALKVGEILRDGSLDMDFMMSGIEGNIKMDVSDRKVVAKEKVTTPAGSWDAFKITSKSKTAMKMMVPMPSMVIESTDWFVPGFGMVKSESKTGKTELLSIESL